MFAHDDRRLRVLRPFLAATARHGCLDVARIGGRIAGAALWMPPGAWPAFPARKMRMTPALTRRCSPPAAVPGHGSGREPNVACYERFGFAVNRSLGALFPVNRWLDEQKVVKP